MYNHKTEYYRVVHKSTYTVEQRNELGEYIQNHMNMKLKTQHFKLPRDEEIT